MGEKKWQKLNADPIPIEMVEDEHEEALDFEPSFWFDNRRYYLKDFACTKNPWVGGEWPDFIHGYEMETYYSPLFIEVLDSEAVNVYKEVR